MKGTISEQVAILAGKAHGLKMVLEDQTADERDIRVAIETDQQLRDACKTMLAENKAAILEALQKHDAPVQVGKDFYDAGTEWKVDQIGDDADIARAIRAAGFDPTAHLGAKPWKHGSLSKILTKDVWQTFFDRREDPKIRIRKRDPNYQKGQSPRKDSP